MGKMVKATHPAVMLTPLCYNQSVLLLDCELVYDYGKGSCYNTDFRSRGRH